MFPPSLSPRNPTRRPLRGIGVTGEVFWLHETKMRSREGRWA
jgi:hypothetical protein